MGQLVSSPNSYVTKSWPPAPQNGTEFGERAFREKKLTRGHLEGPNSVWLVSLEEEVRTQRDTSGERKGRVRTQREGSRRQANERGLWRIQTCQRRDLGFPASICYLAIEACLDSYWRPASSASPRFRMFWSSCISWGWAFVTNMSQTSPLSSSGVFCGRWWCARGDQGLLENDPCTAKPERALVAQERVDALRALACTPSLALGPCTGLSSTRVLLFSIMKAVISIPET